MGQELPSPSRFLLSLVYAQGDLYGRSGVARIQNRPQRPGRRQGHRRDTRNTTEPPPASYLLFEAWSHSEAIAMEPFRGIGS
jgi:hypothetical protein